MSYSGCVRPNALPDFAAERGSAPRFTVSGPCYGYTDWEFGPKSAVCALLRGKLRWSKAGCSEGSAKSLSTYIRSGKNLGCVSGDSALFSSASGRSMR